MAGYLIRTQNGKKGPFDRSVLARLVDQGKLSRETRVLAADTGQVVTLGSVLEAGEQGAPAATGSPSGSHRPRKSRGAARRGSGRSRSAARGTSGTRGARAGVSSARRPALRAYAHLAHAPARVSIPVIVACVALLVVMAAFHVFLHRMEIQPDWSPARAAGFAAGYGLAIAGGVGLLSLGASAVAGASKRVFQVSFVVLTGLGCLWLLVPPDFVGSGGPAGAGGAAARDRAGAVAPGFETVSVPNSPLHLSKPVQWVPSTTLHADAELQFVELASSLVFLVLVEPKARAPVDMTLPRYSELTRALLAEDATAFEEIGSPEALTLGGMPCVQVTILKTVDGARLRFLHVSVEGASHYYQLIVGAPFAGYEQHVPTIEAVLESIGET